jgi:N-acetylmuramoyl-L-alanine amidase
MLKSKNPRTLLITMVLTLTIPVLASFKAQAATYTVAAGDSLYKISKTFNTTTTNLINDNSLKGTTIIPGQVLYVSCKTYITQKGDSLYLIAKKYGIPLLNLISANNISTSYIVPGQKINIPVGYVAPVVTQAPAVSTPVTTTVSYTSQDVDLLARLITAEASGQPYEAKVAVGAVVLNRIKNGTFANTISGVIYETINGYHQFTPVTNGLINNPADADAVKAANAALSGEDPTKGALFYFDDSTTNKWLWSKTIAIIIDKLVFVY